MGNWGPEGEVICHRWQAGSPCSQPLPPASQGRACPQKVGTKLSGIWNGSPEDSATETRTHAAERGVCRGALGGAGSAAPAVTCGGQGPWTCPTGPLGGGPGDRHQLNMQWSRLRRRSLRGSESHIPKGYVSPGQRPFGRVPGEEGRETFQLGGLKFPRNSALAGVAQWIERGPANRKVALLIPSGLMPGLWARSPVGGVQEATNVALPLFLPPFPSLKVNK